MFHTFCLNSLHFFNQSDSYYNLTINVKSKSLKSSLESCFLTFVYIPKVLLQSVFLLRAHIETFGDAYLLPTPT